MRVRLNKIGYKRWCFILFWFQSSLENILPKSVKLITVYFIVYQQTLYNKNGPSKFSFTNLFYTIFVLTSLTALLSIMWVFAVNFTLGAARSLFVVVFFFLYLAAVSVPQHQLYRLVNKNTIKFYECWHIMSTFIKLRLCVNWKALNF